MHSRTPAAALVLGCTCAVCNVQKGRIRAGRMHVAVSDGAEAPCHELMIRRVLLL